MLLVWPLLSVMRSSDETSRSRLLIGPLSVLGWSGFLLGTVGGLGAIIGMFFTQIRAYNRVSIFLAFFALAALAVGIDAAVGRFADPGTAAVQTGVWIVCGVLLVFGLLDQVVPAYLPDYRALAYQDQSDTQIVAAMETRLPKDAMVFQLPYVPYPEGAETLNPWPAKLVDYELFRGPLHSNKLRWSYGTMKGRAGDTAYKHTAGLPLAEMIAQVKKDGFSAIWVERAGYSDNGKQIESQLAQLTRTRPIVSMDEQVSVFPVK
jgi:phosphoglycerol transferase